jgi:hypothetical protein
MRGRLLIFMLAIAIAPAGCADQVTGAAAYTCGHMRDTVGTFRDQARLLVDHEGFKTSALSVEEAVLDVELELRHACRGAEDGYAPYASVADAAPLRVRRRSAPRAACLAVQASRFPIPIDRWLLPALPDPASTHLHGVDRSVQALPIGETGFEPATARPPAGCATRLRHSPW